MQRGLYPHLAGRRPQLWRNQLTEIPLNTGRVALVDDEDAPIILRHRWREHVSHQTSYARMYFSAQDQGERKRLAVFSMHRLVMGPYKTGFVIDHRDGNGLNNQKTNLRFCTPRQNRMNVHPDQGKRSTKGTGFTGIRLVNGRRYHVVICFEGKQHYVGQYGELDEAIEARKQAFNSMFGEFSPFLRPANGAI